MCIARSVGLGARNDVADVRFVQVLLNLNAGAWSGATPMPLGVDGQIGPNTIDAIQRVGRAPGASRASEMHCWGAEGR